MQCRLVSQPGAAGTRNEGVQQHALQVAAMNRELWMLVAGRTPERLLIDQLAEAVEEGRVRRRNCDLRQIVLEAERGEFLCRVRQQVDADTDRADFGGRFENAARNSGLMQRKPERQTADSSADDNDLVHVLPCQLLAGMKQY